MVIAGPTAVGKSEVAFKLAKRHNGEIINADSVQIYQEVSIGTSKPPNDWFKEVPHHLFNFISINKEFTVFDYKTLARNVIKDIKERGKLPVIVGGTGLYIRGLLHGIFEQPKADKKLREELQAEENETPGILHIKLKEIDPDSANKIHPNDLVRIIRAIEVWELTGTKISDLQKEHKFNDSPYNYKGVFLIKPENILKDNIKKRTKKIIEDGIIDEVKTILNNNFSRDLKPLKTVGYKETIEYIDGKINSIEKLEEKINQSTWRLARRQKIWFKKEKGFTILENKTNIIEEIMNI